MLFVLSKLLFIFIIPVTWITVLLLYAVLTKKQKRKKVAVFSALILLYLFSAGLPLHLFSRAWDVSHTGLKPKSRYSCAVVLGGFVSADAQENGFFNTSADRFIQGVELYKAGKVSHVLVTGGNGSIIPGRFSEAEWTMSHLRLAGIPDSAIIIEGRARNTEENIAFSKPILKAHKLNGPYLLVTSAFHMRRALAICEKQHLDIIPYSCNYLVSDGPVSLGELWPDAQNLAWWQYYIKEVIGLIVVKLKH